MNIAKILKNCPKGTKLYSSIFGELSLLYVLSCSLYPIYCKVIRSGSTVSFTEDGKRNITDAEPTLFPSKDQRDWSKFVVSDQVNDQETKHQFKPFDWVLVRNSDTDKWLAGFFENFEKSWNNPYHIMNLHHMTDFAFKQCIPYEGNEHLVGTTNKPE